MRKGGVGGTIGVAGCLVGISCGPPPRVEPPKPPATVVAPSAKPSAEPVPRTEAETEGCEKAGDRLTQLLTYDGAVPRCDLLGIEQALSRCPDLRERVAYGLEKVWSLRRERHGEISARGAFVMDVAAPDDTRVWEMVGDTPTLRARVERGSVTLLGGGKVAVTTTDGLFFLDVRTGKRAGIQGGRLAAESASHLFAQKGDSVVRFDASDLSMAGEVGIGPGDGYSATALALDDGKALAIRDLLVRFDPPRVVATGVKAASVRADGKRFLACRKDDAEAVEVDATTGSIGKPMGFDGAVCGEAGASVHSTPTYTPTSGHAFWFERGKETQDAGSEMILAVGDVATGKIRRAKDPSHTWSTAFASRPYVDGFTGLLCQSLASFHWSSDECSWSAAKDGTPGFVKGGIASRFGKWGIAGAREIARAASPSGERAAYLTHRLSGTSSTDLRLTVVGKDGKVLAKKVLRQGKHEMPERNPEAFWEKEPSGTLVFSGEGFVSVFAGEFGLATPQVVDVATGGARELCDEDWPCIPAGEAVIWEKGIVLPEKAKTVPLVATDAEWAAAFGVPAPCDEPPR